ncbi:peptidase C69 [Micractinium conductrix]|uniref:Peptidase C69 n=1 Tax=Micractinium conductrix TaxID=554055 RepID=A0A2P6V1I2_9CHLO|nr:peptidase C69 [Micractinium conductrix]|eukprot:PSC67957.1 peptidase C69 [Micractinium conductrix]
MTRAAVGAAALLLLAAALPAAAQDWKCRMAPGSTYSGCGLPFELSNFQGHFQCDSRVKVGRPATIDQLTAIVKTFPRVKANGVGSSWWSEQFCAGTDERAINVVMTELQATLSFIKSPVDPSVWLKSDMPADFPIKVDEDAATVTVAAGMPQRLLLDYLSEYVHWKQPQGWTLPAFTWWTDQTVGGAVATGSHGSSMKYGSLSSQVLSLTLLTANGTLRTLTPQADPHLFRAAGVSVGRLGVIVDLTFRIRPQMAVRKSLQELKFADFAAQVKATQDKYVAAKRRRDVAGQKAALFELDETQALWIVENDAVWRTDFKYLDKDPEDVLLNVLPGLEEGPPVEAFSGEDPTDESVFAQRSRNPIPPNPAMTRNPAFWGRFYATLGRQYVNPGTWESRKAFLAMTEDGARLTSALAPYIQMEVAVPLDLAGDCLVGLGKEIYGSKQLQEGFRNPALVRFTTVNIENWISLSSGQPNDKFDAVMRYFRDRCMARLHPGKGGWTEYAHCFDGAKEYPNSWCSFGCAVEELDPAGKFAGAGAGKFEIWRWNATRGGAEVPLASCSDRQTTAATFRVAALVQRIASERRALPGMPHRCLLALAATALLLLALGPQHASACTSYIVGAAASTDGSVLIARNDDGEGAVSPNWLVYHPRREGPAPWAANLNNLSLVLPAPGLAYFALPAGPLADGSGRNTSGEAAGMNEAGVAVSATESIYNSAAALVADPYNEAAGIIEDAIPSLLLPQATSARQGAELLGALVSEHGAGEAFGVLIADRQEAWYLETGSGHHWLAQRVPDRAFFVSANQGRFQDVDLSDASSALASPGLLQFAERAGLWDPSSGEPLNFFKAFMRDGDHDTNYSYPRVCLLQHLWAGYCGGGNCGSEEGSCDVGSSGVPLPCNDMRRQPVFLRPHPRKLGVQDVMAAMRNHWDRSPHDPYTRHNPDEPWRPIALLRTGMGHVTRLRPASKDLPDGLTLITYTALSTPALSPYIPIYIGLPGDQLPPELTAATPDAPDGASLFWKARRLQALVFQDWPSLATHAAAAIRGWEARVEREQRPAMEAGYAAAHAAGDVAAATAELVGFTRRVVRQAAALLDDLAEQAAAGLGLPGVPPAEGWLEMLKEAAEAYAFEPTSDDADAGVAAHVELRSRRERRGSGGGGAVAGPKGSTGSSSSSSLFAEHQVAVQ